MVGKARDRVITPLGGAACSVKALLDQGSLAGDFISTAVFDFLNVNNNCINNSSVDGLRLPICSGLDNSCTDVPVRAVKLKFLLFPKIKRLFLL